MPIELVRAATTFAIRQGWDVNGILHEAGIPPLLLAQGRARVTEDQAIRIVRHLWRLTDDEMFGIGAHPLPRGRYRRRRCCPADRLRWHRSGRPRRWRAAGR